MKLSDYPEIAQKASDRFIKAQILHDLTLAPVVIAAGDGRLAAEFAPSTAGHRAVCDHLTNEIAALDAELVQAGFTIDLPVTHNSRRAGLDDEGEDAGDA